jgi:hypothetical protein
LALASAVALAGVGPTAGTATANPGAITDVAAQGTGVQCSLNGQPVTYTATRGTVHIVSRFHVDATGTAHFTGIVSLQNVMATDGTSATSYHIVGASWFGGQGTSGGTTVTRSTDEFNIIGPNGKVASVHAHLTFYPDGSVQGAVPGDCLPPT